MTAFESDLLFDLAQQAVSWKMLHDPQTGGQMAADQILELCRAAGYTEEASQMAASKRADQRLDSGLPVFQTTFVHQ